MTADADPADSADAADSDDAGPGLEPARLRYLATRAQGFPLGKVLAAGPRATQFLARSTTRNLRFPEQLTHPDIPTRTPRPTTAFGVWADELMLAFMATTRLAFDDAELDRISDEVGAALESLRAAGALDDPARAHRNPETGPELTATPAGYRGVRYQHVTFASEYAPAVDLPGYERWQAIGPNRTAHAFVLRHRRPRPWLVQLHGFGMGKVSDLVAMRSLHFHRDLGFNVLHPVFPVHGERSSGVDGAEALTLDYLNNVHAVSQAMWDVRRLLRWIADDGQPVAVHGVSMGGYLAALLAGVEHDLHTVISGVPTVDLAWVMERHSPDHERLALDERQLLGERAQQIHSIISPLSFAPLVPPGNRYVYAGVADRMATPGQAHRLWSHWEQPSVLWYRGAHISFAWSGEVRRFVDRALHKSGLTPGAHSSSARGGPS